MFNLTPKQIVTQLDHYVIGQLKAKKAMAIALRNRFRRKLISGQLMQEITPHNILMVGPTGVGKTEIARRIAKLTNAPFIKVEATKFTEIGYVGKEVESIIRELLDIAIINTKKELKATMTAKALYKAKIKLVDLIVGKSANFDTKDMFLKKLQNGELDDKEVELSMLEKSSKKPFVQGFDIQGINSSQMGLLNLNDFIGNTLHKEKKKIVKLKVPEAMKYLTEQELESLCNESVVIEAAIKKNRTRRYSVFR